MQGNIIDGRAIAKRIKEEFAEELEVLKKAGIEPKLVTVQAGENSSNALYAKHQKKHCKKLGIAYELKSFGEDVTTQQLVCETKKLNEDRTVTGIMLQLPVPEHIDIGKVCENISPLKDVEGVSPFNMGFVVYEKYCLAPCTALAVKEVIDYTGVCLYGKEAVVVGHSNIVGKPVALMLVNELATVSICHIGTSSAGMLEQHVRRADILIAAVGKPNLIPGEWIKEGAVVIDVGINRVNERIVGDVEFETAKEKASFITLVPGGVGLVTTAILFRNVVKAAKWAK